MTQKRQAMIKKLHNHVYCKPHSCVSAFPQTQKVSEKSQKPSSFCKSLSPLPNKGTDTKLHHLHDKSQLFNNSSNFNH